MNEVSGLLTGLTGLGLAGVGVVLALFAGLRLLFLIRKPGKGRIARGIAAAGLVLVLCGAVLLAAEELDVFRRATDRAPWVLTGVSALLALLAGVRAGRRRKAPGEPAKAAVEEAEKAEPQQPART
jgi:hypothetical protein